MLNKEPLANGAERHERSAAFFENQIAMTVTELAAALRVSERQVNKYVAAGMPSIPMGRERRFLFNEAIAWLRERPKKGRKHGKES